MTELRDGYPRSQDTLTAAQQGDEAAFGSLVAPYRSELQAHCYRMLASVHDAEDVMQDVLLRAWRALPDFRGRSSLRAWLYRIATNACLNLIESRSRRFLPVDLGPSVEGRSTDEAFWIEPFPETSAVRDDESGSPARRYERRESLELAFVAALQYLPPNQRAALILRDVLGFAAKDAAEMLQTTTAAINSALQHARKTVEARVPERSQQMTLRQLGDAGIRRVVERYVRALEDADIDGVVAMLAEDATWSMPPMPAWYQGHESISRFLVTGPFTVGWRHLATEANGQPAVACYAWDDTAGAYVATVIDVLSLDGEQITAVTAFVDPSLFPRFNLPTQLPVEARTDEVTVTTLRHHTEPDTLVLTPDGTIHTGEVPALLKAAHALLDSEPRTRVVLDLSLVRAPGLAAIDFLMRLHLLARRCGRALEIRHIPASLDQALQQTGLSESLPLQEICRCRACSER